MEKGLDHTEGTDMEGTLADPVKIRQWQVSRKLVPVVLILPLLLHPHVHDEFVT